MSHNWPGTLPDGRILMCGSARCYGRAVCEDPQACTSCLPGALGITYRQLDVWARQGHLHPVGTSGSGRTRWWPVAEADVARKMGLLTGAGLPVQWAAAFVRGDWPEGELAPGITVQVST